MSETIQRALIIAAFAMCALLSAILFWEGVEAHKLAHDFAVYWRAANEPAQYAYADWHAKPFPYAPTMLVWIAPLGFLSATIGYVAISVAGIVALALSCRPYLSRPAIILTLISAPMVRCIRNGQVSAILAALLIWSCETRNRIMAGVALGIIASIKPQLVIMAPLMLALNRDWRAFASSALTLAGVAMLALALYGPDRWPEWIASMGHFRSVVFDNNVLGIAVTPAAIAEKFGLPPLPFMLAGTAAGAGLVYLCRDMGPLEKATAIGAGSLLAAPYGLAYDLVVIAPFLASALMRGRLLALVGVTGVFGPVALLIAGYELLTASAKVRQSSSV